MDMFSSPDKIFKDIYNKDTYISVFIKKNNKKKIIIVSKIVI